MSSYPTIGDFNAYVRERAPSAIRRDRAWGFTLPLLEPYRDLDNTQAEIILDMDLEVATGAALDRLGHGVAEDRGGLSDDEYRRIIMGRDAAGAAQGARAGILACWLALTGASPDRVKQRRYGPADLPVVWLEAEYRAVPSASFLIRAGRVILDAVAYPVDVVAIMLPAGGLLFDGLPGFDAAPTGYQLPTERDA